MNRCSAFTLLLACFVVSSALIPIEADARGRVRIRSAGLRAGQQHVGPVLSRDELRVCLQREQGLDQRSDDIDDQQRTLKAKETELDALKQAIDRKRTSVDRNSDKSVNDFNALVGEHRRLVREYNESLPMFNKRVADYQSEQTSFNTQCAGKAYYESDKQAVIAAQK